MMTCRAIIAVGIELAGHLLSSCFWQKNDQQLSLLNLLGWIEFFT